MRAIFGVLGLLVTLAIVGVLAKKQLGASQQALPVLSVPAVPGVENSITQPAGTAREQSQQIQQQYKQALESAMQQARPELDEKTEK